MKQGTTQLGAHITLADLARDPSLFVRFCLGVITNLKLFLGYVCYGINTFLIAIALKGRELSQALSHHCVDLRVGGYSLLVLSAGRAYELL